MTVAFITFITTVIVPIADVTRRYAIFIIATKAGSFFAACGTVAFITCITTVVVPIAGPIRRYAHSIIATEGGGAVAGTPLSFPEFRDPILFVLKCNNVQNGYAG
jgi:hypothetical protein